jgi:hypothetical protein
MKSVVDIITVPTTGASKIDGLIEEMCSRTGVHSPGKKLCKYPRLDCVTGFIKLMQKKKINVRRPLVFGAEIFGHSDPPVSLK